MRKTEKEIERLVRVLYERNKKIIKSIKQTYMGLGPEDYRKCTLFTDHRRFFGFIIYKDEVMEMIPFVDECVYDIKDVERLFNYLKENDCLFSKIRSMVLSYYDCVWKDSERFKAFHFVYNRFK